MRLVLVFLRPKVDFLILNVHIQIPALVSSLLAWSFCRYITFLMLAWLAYNGGIHVLIGLAVPIQGFDL